MAFKVDADFHYCCVPPISPLLHRSPNVYSSNHSLSCSLDKRLKRVLSQESLSHTTIFSGSSLKRSTSASECVVTTICMRLEASRSASATKRSEERRVGKECRYRRAADREK